MTPEITRGLNANMEGEKKKGRQKEKKEENETKCIRKCQK